MLIQSIVCYVVSAHTGAIYPKGQKGYKTLSPPANAIQDIHYRIQCLASCFNDIFRHFCSTVKQNGTLILINVPEFYFRGNHINGYYLAHELHTKTVRLRPRYIDRRQMAKNVANAVADAFNMVIQENRKLILRIQNFSLIVCAGSIPISRGQQSNHGRYIRIDNFALCFSMIYALQGSDWKRTFVYETAISKRRHHGGDYYSEQSTIETIERPGPASSASASSADASSASASSASASSASASSASASSASASSASFSRERSQTEDDDDDDDDESAKLPKPPKPPKMPIFYSKFRSPHFKQKSETERAASPVESLIMHLPMLTWPETTYRPAGPISVGVEVCSDHREEAIKSELQSNPTLPLNDIVIVTSCGLNRSIFSSVVGALRFGGVFVHVDGINQDLMSFLTLYPGAKGKPRSYDLKERIILIAPQMPYDPQGLFNWPDEQWNPSVDPMQGYFLGEINPTTFVPRIVLETLHGANPGSKIDSDSDS